MKFVSCIIQGGDELQVCLKWKNRSKEWHKGSTDIHNSVMMLLTNWRRAYFGFMKPLWLLSIRGDESRLLPCYTKLPGEHLVVRAISRFVTVIPPSCSPNYIHTLDDDCIMRFSLSIARE